MAGIWTQQSWLLSGSGWAGNSQGLAILINRLPVHMGDEQKSFECWTATFAFAILAPSIR